MTFRADKFIFAFVFSCLFSTTNVSYGSGPESYHYKTIKKIGLNLLKSYPPKNSLIITVGRSLGLINIFMNELIPGSAQALPLSNVGNGLYDYRFSRSDVENEMKRYFDRILPSDAELKGRSIVLADYSFGAGSIFRVKEIMKDYLRENGRNTKVTVAVVYHIRNTRAILSHSKFSTKLIPFGFLSEYGNDLVSQNMDYFSPYGPFDILEIKDELMPVFYAEENSIYLAAKEFIKNKINEDPSLNRWRAHPNQAIKRCLHYLRRIII